MKRNLLSGLDDVDMSQHLLAELHDDIRNRVARLHMITDLSRELSIDGVMLTGGTVSYRAWIEARGAFINGQFIATVLLCQGLLENLLASNLQSQLEPIPLPEKATARAIRRYCRENGFITKEEEDELELLEGIRNPLTHYRQANDPEHIDQQATRESVNSVEILQRNAIFATTLTMRILGKPFFRLTFSPT